ncbi:MAG: hypothetical protein Phyf2KO_16910 [Phycisphaerales bacterium]
MGVSETYSQLHSLHNELRGWLVNNRYCRRGMTISWTEFTTQHRLPYAPSPVDVARLADSRQYSFQVNDGSLIQLYYEFEADGETLRWANLLYCASGNLETEEGSEEEIEALSMAYDAPDDVSTTTVPWVRIDYAPEHGSEMIHNECHMHVSNMPRTRMGLEGVPTPRQFVEAIMAWFYPEEYKRRHLDDSGDLVDVDRPEKVNEPSHACRDEMRARMRVLHLRAMS